MAKTRSSRIHSLIKELETLPHTELPEDSSLKANFYPFSNERNLHQPIQTLKTMPIKPADKGTLRIAMLIGESSVFSMLPELSRHCDLVVFADINPYLMQHTRRLHALLTTSTTMTSFEREYDKWVTESPLFEDFKAEQVTPNLQMRKETLGSHHFLFRKARFTECRAAAQKMKFAFCHANLFDENNRNAFFNCINTRKAKISFFNATNLYEWDATTPLAKVSSHQDWKPSGEMKKILSQMTPCPIIMGSLRENATENCPLNTTLFFSQNEYFKINQQNAANYIDKLAQAKKAKTKIKTNLPSNLNLRQPTRVFMPLFQFKQTVKQVKIPDCAPCLPDSIAPTVSAPRSLMT